MPEATNLIKNPLTIIATFATLAEVSGMAVLPFISDANQFYFMCFLMTFPTALVFLFFGTLNFNHHVLYAPSDFRDEENYFKRLTKSSSVERSVKIQEEVSEIRPQMNTDVKLEAGSLSKVPLKNPGDASKESRPLKPLRDYEKAYEKAERLALLKLATDWPHTIVPGMTLTLNGGRKIFADAVSVDGKGTTIFEIKYYPGGAASQGQIKLGLSKLKNIYADLPDHAASNLTVTLLIITDRPMPQDTELKLVDAIQNDPNRFKYLGRIIFYNIDDLEKDFKSTDA